MTVREAMKALIGASAVGIAVGLAFVFTSTTFNQSIFPLGIVFVCVGVLAGAITYLRQTAEPKWWGD